MRAEQLIGQVLGHYRILRLLGYGGTASVFLADDINLHREVAIKVFQPREGETQGFLRRFAREARVLAQLDHPHILPVFDYGEQGGIAYLIVPLMAGGSLKDRLKKQKIIPPAETVHLIGQILSALQYAHDRGLVHRDIKPGNMLFKADGTLLLADFGLVKVLAPDGLVTQPSQNESVSLTGKAITGTPEYMSPEQISGDIGPASDIYSAGVVLYEMLTGEPLFTADNYVGVLMKHLYTPPRPLRQLNPRIPPALEAVVMHCLAKDPNQRYQRPIDLLQALQQSLTAAQPPDTFLTQPAAGSAWPTAPAASPYPPTPPPPREAPAPVLRVPQSHPGSPSSPSAPTTRQDQQALIGNMQREQYAQYQRPVSVATTPTTNPPITAVRKPSATLLMMTLVALVVLLGGGFAFTMFGSRLFPHILLMPTSVAQGQTPPATTASQQTTTSCPTTGAVRKPIMPPIQLGNRQNIIYIVDEGTFKSPIAGTIKRRDVTIYPQGYNEGVEISKMPGTYITEAQVSQDGQWVLFTAVVAGQYQLRMVRVDGQDLQTLYCAQQGTSIANTQWSFNQQMVMFDVTAPPVAATLFLLDMTTGNLQPEVQPDSNLAYIARTWLDNSHVYLVGVAPNSDAPPQNIYLLDIQKGANQHGSDLQRIATTSLNCTNFDTSYDVKQLFISQCSQNGIGPTTGPSTISVQPATGGTAQNIYNSPTQAISTVRGVSPTMLFFMVKNDQGNTSQNGLWRINPDGTGATQLTQDPHNLQSLCPFTQYAWSNLSRDGNLYALQSYDPSTQTYGMYYGSINGGAPIQFANISNVGLFLAGWTTM
jgi:serine/threonine protein kinase